MTGEALVTLRNTSGLTHWVLLAWVIIASMVALYGVVVLWRTRA